MGGASSYRSGSHFVGLAPGREPSGREAAIAERGEKFFGLVNLQNTCYANSVLQALYFCTSFRKNAIRHLLEEREAGEDRGTGGDSLLMSLAELFLQIEGQKRNVGCLTPRRFLAKLRNANDLFCSSEHQDAHEFMEFLLNDIAEDVQQKLQRQRDREKARERRGPQSPTSQQGSEGPVADKPVPATPWEQGGARGGADGPEEPPEQEILTWVHDIFQGYLVNQMKCLCCENVTVRHETFLDLSVDIEQHTSIAGCLRAFESTELLRAENKFFCDTCGCLQEAEKRLRVYQLPSVLTLHLKRFKYVEQLGRCCRLPYRVVFPLQLQVVEHRPPRRAGAAAGSANGANGEKPASRLFELRSVVVHVGREMARGHYVTVVRTGDRCVLLDDEIVRPVEPEALRNFYGVADNGKGNGIAGLCAHPRGGDREWYPSRACPAPLYERSPEGVCCGYLLFYEAVDGAPSDPNVSVVDFSDLGAAGEWISEDRHATDSDSGGSEADSETPDAAHGKDGRSHRRADAGIGASDDSELLQAFEQRCVAGRGSPTAAAAAARRRGVGIDGLAAGPSSVAPTSA